MMDHPPRPAVPRYHLVTIRAGMPDSYALMEQAPEGRYVEWAEVEREIAALRTRAIVAEQHKTLSLLGKSSWQEKVEHDLRVELAEAQARAEAAEAERDQLQIEVKLALAIAQTHKRHLDAAEAERATLQVELATLRGE